jgi:hypothetical protein
MQNSCAPNFSLQVKPLRSYWVVVIDGMGELEQKVILTKSQKEQLFQGLHLIVANRTSWF